MRFLSLDPTRISRVAANRRLSFVQSTIIRHRIGVLSLTLLFLSGFFAACYGDSYGTTAKSPNPSPLPSGASFAKTASGHFRGTAAIGQISYNAEALVTAGGAVRVAVWGPSSGTGARSGAGFSGEDLDPEESLQFSGHVETVDNESAHGFGIVTGQICAAGDPRRFCDGAVRAEFSLVVSPAGNLNGSITVATTQRDVSWQLDLTQWSAYSTLVANVTDLQGMYSEMLAEFAVKGDTVISIDGKGHMFFQASVSGCIANGRLQPHGDGSNYIFDIELVIANCNSTFSHLNGTFSGIGTGTQNGYWDYDFWLLVLATKSGPSTPDAAITMFAGGN